MTITYSWKITGLKTRDEGANKASVVQTYWSKTGTTVDGHTGTFNGATPFTSTTMPDGDVFIPFEQLTEEIVLKWIQDIVAANPTYEQHINDVILEQIKQSVAPVTDPKLPWVIQPTEI